MAIVIAFIIIVAGYVGYHASQDAGYEKEADAHSILPESQIHSYKFSQMIQIEPDQIIIR